MSQDELDEREIERLCVENDNLKAEIERLHAVARDNQKLAAARGVEIERLRAENIAIGRLNEQLVKSLADAAATKPAT